MKRLRHYNKDLAVILSVFGTSEQSAFWQYLKLFDEVKQILPPDTELRIAISSRTVLKKLEQQGNNHFTLTEQLASLDRLGYKKVIVASVNVFPTEEHEHLQRIVDAFDLNISIAKYHVTKPLFTKAKKTNEYLNFLNDSLRSKYDVSNIVFVAHGATNLNSPGSQAFKYVRDYLRLINPRNFFYTIEGAFAYDKETALLEIKKEDSDLSGGVLVVPLLLVPGVHSQDDVQEIKKGLSESFNTAIIPENFLSDGDFSLLNLQEIRNYFKEEIQEAIKRINW